jgi:hypothetical protein
MTCFYEGDGFFATRGKTTEGKQAVFVYERESCWFVGHLDVEATEVDVKNIIEIYKRAHQRGIERGRAQLQQGLRLILGVDKPTR